MEPFIRRAYANGLPGRNRRGVLGDSLTATSPQPTPPSDRKLAGRNCRAIATVHRLGEKIMPRVIPVILILIGASAIVAGSYAAHAPGPPSIKAASDQKVGPLELLAEKSCRCERSAKNKNGKASCWAEFDRALPAGSDTMTACDPVSETGRCGGSGEMIKNPDGTVKFDSGPCVTMRYEYFSSSGETTLLCSRNEARMVEHSWGKELSPDATGAVRTPRTDQLARDLVAGKPPGAIDGPKGCTG